MRSAPIEPAALAFDAAGTPFSARYRDRYHPLDGALRQAREVFLAGNGLPERWRGRGQFVVLETGFGLGSNFLATWRAWRDDPRRSARLTFLSVERHPLGRADLARVPRESPLADLAGALERAWPPLTPDLHDLAFDDGRVRLLLAFGDAHDWLPDWVASVDAIYLDGFAPALNPDLWDERICKAVARLAAPGATLATWSAAHGVRERLAGAGFAIGLGAGSGGKRDITLGRYAPAFETRRPVPRGALRGAVEPRALIVGGGLAGCAAALGLAEHGWRTTLFDAQPAIATQASGNPAGLFHAIAGADDGVHGRLHRAASFAVARAVQVACARHAVRGAADGLLRLENTLDPAAMQARLQRHGWPDDHVRALDAAQASDAAGIALVAPGWFFPDGGWVDPGGLARSYLERAGDAVRIAPGVAVHALQRTDDGWRLLDRNGHTLDEAPTVVLANAGDALRLLDRTGWPVAPVRGQISIAPQQRAAFATPRIPVAGAGYLVPAFDGRIVFGATTQPRDPDPAVRVEDHRHNLARLERLVARPVGLEVGDLAGRVGWRWSAADRLPIVGAVPDPAFAGGSAAAGAAALRLEQPRFVPRLPGLFVFTALGSRGIAWSALGARVLGAWVAGAPLPIGSSLLDAIDPARFVSREVRRAARDTPAGGAGDRRDGG